MCLCCTTSFYVVLRRSTSSHDDTRLYKDLYHTSCDELYVLKDFIDHVKMKTNDGIKARTWMNKGWIDDDTEETVVNSHQNLFKYIDGEYQNLDTRKTHLTALVNILRSQDMDDVADKYSKIAVDIHNKTSADKKDNRQMTLSRIRNPVDYNKISELYNKLRKQFDEGTISPYNHVLLTILAVNVLMPPIRSETVDMAIVSPDSDTKNGNLLVKAGKKKPWHLILNDFKTVKSFGKQKIELPVKLKAFLIESLKKMPRSYLVSKPNDPTSPLGYPSFLRMVQKALGEGTGSDVFRSAYISEFMKQNPTMSEREGLAKKMLHSVESQQQHYVKVDDDKPPAKLLDPVKSDKEPERGGSVDSVDVEKLTKDRAEVLKERNDKRRQYRRDYYAKNKETLQAKQRETFESKKDDVNRRRILQKIEESKITGIPYNPKQSTLDKYGIHL